MSKVKSSEIPCKGNVEGNFEMVPMDLFNYLELDLIKKNDFVVYIKLLQYYNEDYGYAFPTLNQLMVMTAIGSKATIDQSIDNLGKVGLIEKAKGYKGNNVYRVFKPLQQVELYNQVPEKVKLLEKRKEKLNTLAENDKERLKQYREVTKNEM